MGRKRKAPAPTPEKVEGLAYIAEPLRALAVPVEQLVPDPANARKHGKENLEAIAASLRVYGQRKPIVANRTNSVVLSGNGTLTAAKSLGWSHLAVVWVEDDPATAAGFSIADNRTAELAEWDEDALGKLLESVQTGDQDLASMFDQLAQDLDLVPGDEPAGDKPAGEVVHKHQIIIECKDEAHQLELLERFDTEGLECKALTI